MTSSKAVGAGAFIVIGVLLFTVALFMIGERRMLFQSKYELYTEFARLGQLENGAVVRVAGMDAGEVTEIRIPASPSEKFRVRLEVREDNVRAIALYERCGYRLRDRVPEYYADGATALRFLKSLSKAGAAAA